METHWALSLHNPKDKHWPGIVFKNSEKKNVDTEASAAVAEINGNGENI